MTRTLSLADRWRRSGYLWRVEMWLDPLPARRRRAVLQELRSNLDAASVEVGPAAALADLGHPRVLACQYLQEEPTRRPRWNQGALAAGLVIAAWAYATLFYAFGMLDALRSAGAPTASGSFLGTHVSAAVTAGGGVSAGFTGVAWLPLLLALVAFLVVGRAWNALPGRARSSASATG